MSIMAMSSGPRGGDQIWLNYVNLFVDTIKLDGRLLKYAKKHKLDPIVAPRPMAHASRRRYAPPQDEAGNYCNIPSACM